MGLSVMGQRPASIRGRRRSGSGSLAVARIYYVLHPSAS